MALTKKDRQEVAEMIARVVTSVDTGSDVDSQDIENAAQEPDWKLFRDIKRIDIRTGRSGINTPAPEHDEELPNEVYIRGIVDGEELVKRFVFPPNNVQILSELKRIQNHPHLIPLVVVTFRESSTSVPHIIRIAIIFEVT